MAVLPPGRPKSSRRLQPRKSTVSKSDRSIAFHFYIASAHRQYIERQRHHYDWPPRRRSAALPVAMSLRLASLRQLRPASIPFRPIALRAYATPSQPPRPSQNAPTPKGLESVFGGSGGKRGTTVAPKPPGSEPPAGPSLPKRPDVELPGGERGERGERAKEEHEEEDGERSQLGGKAGKKVATGGGGGGGSGGSGGPGGMPGGFGGMTPNQLLLAVVSTYALYSLAQPGDQRTREITWQEL